MTEPVYEMFWDCPYCGTKELLGLTQRFCPTCGAPQQADKRYFPPEDRKVAVADHRFVGTDLICQNCQGANSANASHCTSCGATIGDGDREVVKREDQPVRAPAPAATPTPAPAKKSKLWIWLLVAALLALMVLGGVAIFWKQEKAITVTGQSWQRSVAIEVLQTANESAWCDSVPSGGRVTGRSREQRSTRRVESGQTCSTRNVDNGDGTYRQEQTCTPTYREEPVLDDKCQYQIDRWAHQRDAVAQGQGVSPAPSWPAVQVTGCASLGCTRQGARSETYTLNVTVDGAGADTCTVPQARWQQITPNSRFKARVGVLTHHVDCSNLTPL